MSAMEVLAEGRLGLSELRRVRIWSCPYAAAITTATPDAATRFRCPPTRASRRAAIFVSAVHRLQKRAGDRSP